MGMISIFLLIGANYSLAQELDHREFRTEQCFNATGRCEQREYEKSKHGNLDCIYCHDLMIQKEKEAKGSD